MSKRRRYTADERREIVSAAMAENGGVWDPVAFVECCRSTNHPAHDWFQWDIGKAAEAHWLWQAREFAKVRIEVTAEVEVSSGKVDIEVSAPMVVSPMGTKEPHYIATNSEEGREELRRQAVAAGYGLKAWLRRYRLVLHDDEVKRAKGLIRLIERNQT